MTFRTPGSCATLRLHLWLPGMLVLSALPSAFAGTTVIDNPGPGRNRIEVTNNSARNVEVRCADGSSGRGANVNSVNIDARALNGRTEVITGRNVDNVRSTSNCDTGNVGAPGTATRGVPAANVNSVNIR